MTRLGLTRSARRYDDPLVDTMRAVVEGNEEALRRLFDAIQHRMMGVVQGILGDAGAAEEVLLDVFALVWRKAGSFDPDRGSVLLWATTIARRRAIDWLRTRGVRSESVVEQDSDEPPMAPDPTPLQASQGSERAERVREALSRLPADQRRAIETAFYQGLSHSEVASTLGWPLGTVKSRIRVGLNSLKGLLADDGETPP